MFTALGLLGAGLASAAGAAYAANRNASAQGDTNWLQVALANTAHQREVQDLQKAGLNPVLSAGGAGASVPQLGTPTMSNPLSGLSDSIQSAVRMASIEVPKAESEIAVNAASARNLEAQNSNLHAQNDLLKAQADEVRSRIVANKYGTGVIGKEIITPVTNAFNDSASWFNYYLPRLQNAASSIQWLPDKTFIDRAKSIFFRGASAVKDAFRPPRDSVMQDAFRKQHKRRSQH